MNSRHRVAVFAATAALVFGVPLASCGTADDVGTSATTSSAVPVTSASSTTTTTAAPSTTTTTEAPPLLKEGSSVLVFSDSIGAEVFGSPEASAVMSGTYKVIHDGTTRFLTAPCSDLDRDLDTIEDPDVIVIHYNGNKGEFGTNCMRDESGEALRVRYRDDLQKLIQKVKKEWPDAKVVLMSGAYRVPAGIENEPVRMAHVDAAKAESVGYFDGSGGISTLTSATASMPCLPVELSKATVIDGEGKTQQFKCLGVEGKDENLVREATINHMCPPPGKLRFSGACENPDGGLIYSSGAVRLAFNMREALAHAE